MCNRVDVLGGSRCGTNEIVVQRLHPMNLCFTGSDAISDSTAEADEMSAIKLSDADRRAIEDQIEKYREAVLAADWAAWGATLSPDVFLSAAFESPRTGRQAAVDWVSAFPSVTAFTIRIDELDGEGGLAFARGRYELEFRMPDGSQSTDDGCWLQTHRRMSDGSWPYTNVMFHSTRAPAP